ncbi:glycoside hydrolase family 65 protein [Amycolatopsis acidiphila]|uniref:Glycoside hydrolase family 65 protein n=1 Tax=Amycolatopsis acidiphila TaxID=715473 RepID=A0A557ZZL8_9PSEU|nr:glycosyl hydrolase family 65 protein [Amycolatopsis acidiphila]TVT17465.1 glycoside hydrolase family 65 protein [Amycolatopsis acidiphila]UIJ62179.1 glycoside hydrolase family 65 protein [Amycolatopsis acidiphila]GHG92410.1 glycosyl hydrolase [Amycolatopsis acidiphila]
MTTPVEGYECDPWQLTWRGLAVDQLQRTESTFALANGHIGLRGTFEEGEPRGLPGTYLNGFYEEHELPYAEAGYGYPEAGQTVVNVTDGKIIRLLVEDEPFDMRYGTATAHDRTLDFRSGTLTRNTDWVSPTGRHVRVRTQRMVSFTQRAVVAIRYEVEPLDDDTQLVLQSDLLANEPIESDTSDPRVAAALQSPLAAEFSFADQYRAVLVHQTRRSGLRIAAAMDHLIESPDGLRTTISEEDDLARLTVAVDVPRGKRLRLTKFLAYGWSAQRSIPALRAQVDAALAGAVQTGWDGLLAEQKAFLDDFWATADIQVDGDPELQQATRFALFHILQAGARGESRAIPGKGLTGPGYDGHAFWDTESFVLPVLTYTMPEAARDALRWRHSTLDKARDRAAQLGLRGAAFPWRSINGAECSAYWPAGTAAFHVSADIADAVARYLAATGDEEFERGCGTEMLAETARLWMSLGHFDFHGRFRIDGVTGPDEYSAVADNNVYTNLMARRNLREAAASCARIPDVAAAIGVTEQEMEEWRDAAARILVPYDAERRVHPQSEGFTEHVDWNFAETPPEHYPLLLHYPYFDLYRKQVVKQADLVLAMHLCGDAFTPEEKARNFAYYEARTVRDSSLSAATQAVMAAEVGHLDLAYDYVGEAALTDLHDVHNNVRNGLHMASLAGAWLGFVAGFGGMRDHEGEITFAPRLPPALDRIGFRMCVRGSRFAVEIHADKATYRLMSGKPVEITHHGAPCTVEETPVTLPIPGIDPGPAPHQPPGRAPSRRRPEGLRPENPVPQS